MILRFEMISLPLSPLLPFVSSMESRRSIIFSPGRMFICLKTQNGFFEFGGSRCRDGMLEFARQVCWTYWGETSNLTSLSSHKWSADICCGEIRFSRFGFSGTKTKTLQVFVNVIWEPEILSQKPNTSLPSCFVGGDKSRGRGDIQDGHISRGGG